MNANMANQEARELGIPKAMGNLLETCERLAKHIANLNTHLEPIMTPLEPVSASDNKNPAPEPRKSQLVDQIDNCREVIRIVNLTIDNFLGRIQI